MNLSQGTPAFQPYCYTPRDPILGYYKRFWHYSRSRWDLKKNHDHHQFTGEILFVNPERTLHQIAIWFNPV